MTSLLISIALFATLAGCYNQRYPGEREPLPRDAVVSGTGAPVTSGSGDAPVTSASDRRR
ncbi:MAG TPA: hypothetical protein VFJ70_23170 [Burkholderiales bacterium]|nr:hypothetical protein [Burkholderiales bacterium]